MSLVIYFVLIAASLGGIGFILWQKIPLLKELPEDSDSVRDVVAEKAKQIVSSQKQKLARSEQFDKTIAKAKTLATQTEKRTGELLGKLQKRQEERKEEFTESYWDQLRKRSKGKK